MLYFQDNAKQIWSKFITVNYKTTFGWVQISYKSFFCALWLKTIVIHGNYDMDSKNCEGSNGKNSLFWKRWTLILQQFKVFSLTQEAKDLIPGHAASVFFSNCRLRSVLRPRCFDIPFKLIFSKFLISFSVLVCTVNCFDWLPQLTLSRPLCWILLRRVEPPQI